MKRVIESGCLILVLLLSSPGYAQRLLATVHVFVVPRDPASPKPRTGV